MSKTTIKELALSLSEKHDLSQADAERFVATLFEVINDGLEDDKLVKVKGLGAFKIIGVAARKSVDVNTGEPIVIEGRNKISFTPDASMRDDVNKPFSQFETVVINDGVDFSSIDKEYENGGVTASAKEHEIETDTTTEDIVESPNTVEHLETVTEPHKAVAETPEAVADAPEKTVVEAPEATETAAEDTKTVAEATEAAAESPDTITESPKTVDDNPNNAEETTTEEDAAISKQDVEPLPVKQIEGNKEPRKEEKGIYSTERSEVDEVAEREIIDEEAHQSHALKALVITAVVIVIGCLCGGYYLFSQIQKRDNHIEMLEKQMKLVAQHQNNSQKNNNGTSQTSKRAAKASQEQDTTSQVANSKQQAIRQIPQAEEKQTALQDQYNKDVRIRTGAYVIVGIKKTVTVRSGQTMDGISRSNLGPGMECYLEAVNGGKRELKAGESIKIPELKLKKLRR